MQLECFEVLLWTDRKGLLCCGVIMDLDIIDMVNFVRLNEVQRIRNGYKGEQMSKRNTNKIKGKIG